MQGGVEAMALYRELACGGDEPVPGKLPGPLKKLVEGGRREGAQVDEHPLPRPQPKVEPGNVRRLALAEDPAVVRPDLLHAHPAQLLRGDPLHPEQGGDHKGQFVHWAPLLSFSVYRNSPMQYTWSGRLWQTFSVSRGDFFDSDLPTPAPSGLFPGFFASFLAICAAICYATAKICWGNLSSPGICL